MAREGQRMLALAMDQSAPNMECMHLWLRAGVPSPHLTGNEACVGAAGAGIVEQGVGVVARQAPWGVTVGVQLGAASCAASTSISVSISTSVSVSRSSQLGQHRVSFSSKLGQQRQQQEDEL